MKQMRGAVDAAQSVTLQPFHGPNSLIMTRCTRTMLVPCTMLLVYHGDPRSSTMENSEATHPCGEAFS